jgi:hypothetical protein
MMIYGQLALVIASVFAGAAFYINFAEHPARMMLSAGVARTQWEPSYKRGFIMQASLAVAGAVMVVLAWLYSEQLSWLIGGALLFANWPFTLLVIMPVNLRLLAGGISDEETKMLLTRWNAFHAVRTLLGVAATVAFLVSSL